MWRGVAGNCNQSGDNSNGKGKVTDKKLVDLANMRQKETREDQNNVDKRKGQSHARCLGNLDCRVPRGQ